MKTGTKTTIGAGVIGFLALTGAGVEGSKHMVGPTGEPQALDASMFAQGAPEAPGIDITTPVNAPRPEVYKRFTTTQGWKTFLDASSDIDLRIGGQWEVYFDPQAKIGSNGCQVLSYLPNEMVAFTWNAPPKFPAERAMRTWVVVTLADAKDGITNVRLRHFGFPDQGNWPEVKTYFVNAWPRVLKALADSFQSR